MSRIAGFIAIPGVVLLVLGALAWLLLPRDPLELGTAAYSRGDWSAAELYARQAILDDLDDPEGLRLLARTNARLGRDAAAGDLFRRLGPGLAQPEDLTLMGSILLRRGERGQGMILLERARDAEPGRAETLRPLAEVYIDTDFPAAAVEVAEQLVSISPSIDAHRLLGRSSRAVGDHRRAARAFERALALAAGDASRETKAIQRDLARSLLHLGESTGASRVLEPVTGDEAAWLASRAALQSGDVAAHRRFSRAAEAYRSQRPLEPEPAPFVGSASCLPCHEAVARAHASSRHFHTFRREGELSDAVAITSDPIRDPRDPRIHHRIEAREGRIRASVDSGAATIHALAVYALGSGHRGRSLIVRDSENRSREYRLTHYARGVGWDLTMHHPAQPATLADALGQPLLADNVRACVGCHVTDSFASTDVDSPLVRESGVGCERCHGPGGNHLRAVAKGLEDLAIVRPNLADTADRVGLCAQCHKAPRGVDLLGDDAARFAWPKLGSSRCFTESGGAMDCVTCHSPHRDAVVDKARYERICLDCHSGRPLASTGKRPAVCTVDPETKCLECHMPRVQDAIPHTSFTDHLIRIRRPDPLELEPRGGTRRPVGSID
ncbi:MAG: cytochrome c3 family protein [Isosphaeraceae bacterium]|nr:cytochrome c3 family protein [Isosphaeraceae bacterium]